MAFYGVNATKAFVNVPSDKVDVTDWGAKVRHVYDSYVVTAAPGWRQTLQNGKLPKVPRSSARVSVTPDPVLWALSTWATSTSTRPDGSAVTNAFFASVDVHTPLPRTRWPVRKLATCTNSLVKHTW